LASPEATARSAMATWRPRSSARAWVSRRARRSARVMSAPLVTSLP